MFSYTNFVFYIKKINHLPKATNVTNDIVTYDVCRLWQIMLFVAYEVCHIIGFVAYDVCCIIGFVPYDVCRIIGFVAYDVCRIMTFVAHYDVCRLEGLSQYPNT